MNAQTESIASLGSRLTSPGDRETYAALISYADSLPEGDEFRRLVQLLGLHSLLTQRVPDAVAELISELKVLPERVTVDAAEIAAKVGETFRQQVETVGLAEIAVTLEKTTRELRAVSEQVNTCLDGLSSQTKGITKTIAAELATLETAAGKLQRQNAFLVEQNRWGSVLVKVFVGALLLLVGLAGGIEIEMGMRG